MRCLTQKEAADLAAGFLDAEQAACATAHAAQCEDCSKRLDRFAEICESLRPDRGEFEDESFGAEIMTLIDLGRAEKERLPSVQRADRWNRWGRGAVTAAATVLISMTAFYLLSGKDRGASMAVFSDAENDNRFASRSGASSTDQWVSLTLFQRRDENDKAVFYPIDESIPKDAAIACAYEDRSTSPFSYLIVFAVDPNGNFFWYYPADDPNGEPVSIATSGSQGKNPLPDEVVHEFSEGALRFFGIFSHVPLKAVKVEETVKNQLAAVRDLSKLTRIDIKGTGQWTRQILIREEGEE